MGRIHADSMPGQAVSGRVGLGSACGQSTVEAVALLPVLLAVGLAVLSLLGAGRAEEAAGNAAEAGAVALLQGREPRAAARAALGGWPARRTQVRIAGRRVTVRVTPRGPFGTRLRATATADAGALR
jgi:Flp pilus assembly protein TadG